MKKLFCLTALLLSACQDIPTTNKPLDRRSPDSIAWDKTIEQTALDELNSDTNLQQQAHIHVNAYNGLVLLTGEILDPSLKNQVLDSVRVMPHVKMVRDSLDIAPLSSNQSRLADAELARQVQHALTQIQTLPNFDSAMIKVVCDNGIVYLMGLVTKEEGNVVVNVTRLQANVKQIVTVFEYK